MSELQDRLDALASRGTPRGFDAVIDAAARAARLGVVEGDAPGPDDDLETIPFVTEEPIARRRRGRRPGRVFAAAGVAAMLLIGSFAVSALVGSSGAGSPDSAVRRLADAISHGDPLAAADVMAPSEVASLRDTLSTAERRAAELRLVENAGAPLSGVDLSVGGLKLSTESLGRNYAKVVIDAGVLDASTKKAKFSPVMQQVLRNSEDNSASVDLSAIASGRNLPTFVMAVREDGHWYVSAAYTVLEYVREVNGVSAAPRFGAGTDAVAQLGADTPEAAVSGAVEAFARNDWNKVYSLVPPDEIPLYDYADVLNALIAKHDTKTSFTVDKIVTTAKTDGDTAQVELHASGTTDNGSWSIEGGCFNPPADPTSSWNGGFCVGDQSATTSAYFGLFFIFGQTGPGVHSDQAITVVRRDGRWFVSPIGTVLDVLNDFIAHIDRRGLYTMLRIPDQLPPDGTLTLGQPMTIDQQHRGPIVLSYQGHKGEQLLGLATSALPTGRNNFVPAFVSVYSPDGKFLEGDVLMATPVVLPVDGRYKVVIEAYGVAKVTVTLWDAADAPAPAKQNPSGEHCTRTSLNSEMCSASATTIPGG